MSLRLRQAIPGRPSVHTRFNTSAGTIGDEAFIAYTSGSDVVILDSEHDLIETLPFWSALPHRAASSSKQQQQVEGVVWIQTSSLLIAWSGVNIVLWHRHTSDDERAWRVHSTLVASSALTALDYRDGLLVLAHQGGLELWRHDVQAAIIVWDRIWERTMPISEMVIIAPTAGHIAFFAKGERCVRILSIDRKAAIMGIPQEIRHPRELEHIEWRNPHSLSGDPYLYTITTNAVFRIYTPVLDDPTWFQLHGTLDCNSFHPITKSAGGSGSNQAKTRHPPIIGQLKGCICPVDGDVLRHVLMEDLANDAESERKMKQEVRKVLEGIERDEADLLLWAGENGDLAVRSVLNMDRKPPTLLKSSLIAHTRDMLSGGFQPGSHPTFVRSGNAIQAVFPANNQNLSLYSTIRSFSLSLSALLAFEPKGAVVHPKASSGESIPVHLSSPISSFTRTPNGRGLLSIAEDGEVGVWAKEQRGKPVRGIKGAKSLLGRGKWREKARPHLMAIYAKGRAIVSYVHLERQDGREGEADERGSKPYISLQHLSPATSAPAEAIRLPDFDIHRDDRLAMLTAASDIDDGYSLADRKTQEAVIIAVSERGEAWVWTVESKQDNNLTDVTSHVTGQSQPQIRLVSRSTIPVASSSEHSNDATSQKPLHVLPVDPMGWHQSVVDWKNRSLLQDIVLTISNEGLLEFWRPRIGEHMVNSRFQHSKETPRVAHDHEDAQWVRTGSVETNRRQIRAARCSSRKKTVIVCDVEERQHSSQADRAPMGQERNRNQRVKGEMWQEVTIWDSNVGEFSTGLEVRKLYPAVETIQDLDWTTTSDLQSILAIGFPHRIELLCEQRMSYTEGTPGWATFASIDMTRYTPSPIADSIWLAGGSLVVGCQNQIYLFSRYLDKDTPVPTPKSSVRGIKLDEHDEPEDVFQLVASLNGPVVDYHPTLLAQCILWDKIDLVKDILVRFAGALETAISNDRRKIRWKRMDPTDFMVSSPRRTSPPKSGESKYDALFNMAPVEDEPNMDDQPFNPRLVSRLIEHLDNPRLLLPLTRYERSLLGTLAQAVLEVGAERRALDQGGMRYLFSLRMFAQDLHIRSLRSQSFGSNLNTAHTAASSLTLVGLPDGKSSRSTTPIPTTTAMVENGDGTYMSAASSTAARLSFRNIVWASHSESQEVMLSAATQTCQDGKMMWADAKRLGVFLWLKSRDAIKIQLEAIARNRFMAEELRDPTTCSLIFFALGKKKVVHGLWRQAPEHKEQNVMLKFLANDFDLDRWRLAAKKNAYALLSKQRYEYAAAFFMLAGDPKDAISVVVRQMDDWQLAFALARAVEEPVQSEATGPLVRSILERTVLPLAFRGGHRWLATWAFWTLGRRDLAVRVLMSPITDILADFAPLSSTPSTDFQIGFPENDDPSLLLLFRHLRAKSLQTAKGTEAIPGKTEFDFVLHNARVFCRMGCHSLALGLLVGWDFERPMLPERYRDRTREKQSVNEGVEGKRHVASTRLLTDPATGSASETFGFSETVPEHTNTSTAKERLSSTQVPPRSPFSSIRVPSYAKTRRPSFMLTADGAGHGRRESMVADMPPMSDTPGSNIETEEDRDGPCNTQPDADARDKNGEPSTGTGVSDHEASPGLSTDDRQHTSNLDAPGQNSGIGNLIKQEKSVNGNGNGNAEQGAMEFSFDDFGFDPPSTTTTMHTRPNDSDTATAPVHDTTLDGSPIEETVPPTTRQAIGNLMKLANKGDGSQGATEFSFDAFGSDSDSAYPPKQTILTSPAAVNSANEELSEVSDTQGKGTEGTTRKEETVQPMPTKGIGNLMKHEPRGDVSQGAQEFSFDSFGF